MAGRISALMKWDLPPAASGGCTQTLVYGKGCRWSPDSMLVKLRFMTKVNRGVKSAVRAAHVILRQRRGGGVGADV